MSENQIITFIEGVFKEKGHIKTSKDFAELIGENPNGLSDIKAGRKKVNIDHIKHLKNSHPTFNSDLLIMGNGPVFLNEEAASNGAALKVEINELLKDLDAFRSLAISQAQTILNLSRPQAVKEA